MSRDTNRSTTVSDTRAERSDVASFMTTSQTKVIVLSINSDVLIMTLGKLFDSGLDVLHASGFTHGLGGIIGVATSTIPVTLERLGVEGYLDPPLLGDTNEEIAGHPEVVTHRNTFARTDLEFPLSRHNFSIDTTDVNARIEAGTIVSFNEVTSKDLSSS